MILFVSHFSTAVLSSVHLSHATHRPKRRERTTRLGEIYPATSVDFSTLLHWYHTINTCKSYQVLQELQAAVVRHLLCCLVPNSRDGGPMLRKIQSVVSLGKSHVFVVTYQVPGYTVLIVLFFSSSHHPIYFLRPCFFLSFLFVTI